MVANRIKMKVFNLTMFLLLLVCCNYSYGQASWSFSTWFNLYEKDGSIIGKNDFVEQKVKLYSLPFGAHSSNRLEYDTVNNSFRFSQHTITTGSLLVFVINAETIIVDISTKNTYITRLDLVDGRYDLRVWSNEEKFDCTSIGQSTIPACFNKFSFSDYKATKRGEINLKDLVEVKL
jgi:hypothetical protein